LAPAPPTSAVIRVLIADDHRLFAESLRASLCEDERIDVVAIVDNGNDAVQLASELQPDLILMDIRMPVLDGLEATRRIRAAGLGSKVILLTGTRALNGAHASAAGANAFVRKEQSIDVLREVFFEVASLTGLLAPTST
jgi:DNA-binding NarL/FixJ family response regulator